MSTRATEALRVLRPGGQMIIVDFRHAADYVMLLRAGRVLLCHRSPGRRWYPGVWVSRRWPGGIANLQPEEHDAIGWFGKEQLTGLSFADPSYLSLLRGLLTA